MSNDLLRTAIKAAIPIITVHHSDILNVGTVLEGILGVEVGAYPLGKDFDPANAVLSKGKLSKHNIFYSTDQDFKCTPSIYNYLGENDKTLILVNKVESSYSFDAGVITVENDQLVKLLKDFLDTKTIELILPNLQGLTIKGITELLRITSAKEGSITLKGLNNNRPLVTGNVQGLSRVDTYLPLYFPNKDLKAYIDLNKSYFLNKNTPPSLVPKGLLLSGIAGLGKSSASKYLANVLEIPLYRLDLSASLSRYVGSSERNLASILSAIEQENACVFLLDEIEKLFGESDDSGVTSRLLAQLLWFLQEHKNRVLTVMTTNNIKALPPELYRPGRIDQVIELQPLTLGEAYNLGYRVLEQYIDPQHPRISHKKATIKTTIDDLQGNPNNFTPATITGVIQHLIKKHKWV